MWKNISVLLTIVFGILGLIGTVLSIIITLKKVDPVYSVLENPAIIFDIRNPSPKLRLTYDDSLLINENVYITKVFLWNKGRLEIEKEHLRRPFYLHCLDTNGKILEAKIVQQYNPEESNFRLISMGDSIRIDWDYFDPKAGCIIQVIYIGDKTTKLAITGKVGLRVLKEKFLTIDSKTARNTIGMSSIAICLLILSFFGVFHSYNSPKSKYYKDWKAAKAAFVLGLITISLAGLTIILYSIRALPF